MARVAHFEIHTSDPQASIAFYQELFGWSFTQWGEMPYWLIETGPDSEPGINGGLTPCRGGSPAEMQAVNSFVCTVMVDSADETISKGQELGGTVAVPKMPVPGVGWLGYLKDPDGNIFGVMQNDTAAA